MTNPRKSTVTKYHEAAKEAIQLLDKNPVLQHHKFMADRHLSNNFFLELEGLGILQYRGNGEFTLKRKFIVREEIYGMLRRRNTRLRNYAMGTFQRVRKTEKAANDLQQPLELVQPEKPKKGDGSAGYGKNATLETVGYSKPMVSKADYEALERRVAALEQLLIRRGVA